MDCSSDMLRFFLSCLTLTKGHWHWWDLKAIKSWINAVLCSSAIFFAQEICNKTTPFRHKRSLQPTHYSRPAACISHTIAMIHSRKRMHSIFQSHFVLTPAWQASLTSTTRTSWVTTKSTGSNTTWHWRRLLSSSSRQATHFFCRRLYVSKWPTSARTTAWEQRWKSLSTRATPIVGGGRTSLSQSTLALYRCHLNSPAFSAIRGLTSYLHRLTFQMLTTQGWFVG